MEVHPDQQAYPDKYCEKAPFKTGKGIHPEPFPHGCPLEIRWIDSLFNHCHALFVPIVEVYGEHPGSAAKEEYRNKDFAVHNTSGTEFRKLMFEGGFGNFD